jgi:hypothetical protein
MVRLGMSLLACVAISVSGCGGTGDVRGQVALGDKVVKVGSVTLWASDGIPRPASIDSNGVFELKGVPTGEATITVASPDPKQSNIPDGDVPKGIAPRPRAEKKAPDAETVKNWFPIPDRYSDMKKSELKVQIVSGLNEPKLTLVK